MRLFVALTDRDWLDALAGRHELDEVCFWQAAFPRPVRSLRPAELVLFIGHAPERVIAGGGFLVHGTSLPLSVLWSFFGSKAGGAERAPLARRVERARGDGAAGDPEVGCMVLQSFFRFDPSERVAAPDDFHRNVSRGKFYDVAAAAGERLWRAVRERLEADLPGSERASQGGLFGDPWLLPRRVGAGGFKALVLDAYARQCALTGLGLVAALEVAAIRPLEAGGLPRPDNGLLLRADLARLFERGYLTIGEDDTVKVARSLLEQAPELGALAGTQPRLPRRRELRPRPELLAWHREHVFLA
jgi:putative restriction endonuclease